MKAIPEKKVLLEQAAKAAGYDFGDDNPLEHEGESIKLADALRMMVDITEERVTVMVTKPSGAIMTMGAQFRPGRDRPQTIRYIIVRLAAKVGAEMGSTHGVG